MNLDFSAIAAVFGLVLLTELGDKTQLVAFTMVSSIKKPWLVFLASSVAFLATSFLAALFGQFLAGSVAWISTILAPVLFIVFGFIILLKREPSAIEETFINMLGDENRFNRISYKELTRRNLLNADLEKTFGEEEDHKGAVRFMLNRKYLFRDNINKESANFQHYFDEASEIINVKHLSNLEFVAYCVEHEQKVFNFYQYLDNHINKHQEHSEDNFMKQIVGALVEGEKLHVQLYQNLLKEVEKSA